MRDSISEEAQKIWAKTLNLHIKHSKNHELISSSLRSGNNRGHLVVRKAQWMNVKRFESMYLSLKVRYRSGFTRYCKAGEAERKELKFWQKNVTPLLVEKFVSYIKWRGLRHKIEGEMLKLRLMSLQEQVVAYDACQLQAQKGMGNIQVPEVGHMW